MYDYTARHSYPGQNQKEVCDFCGCCFRVETMLQDGHNESEEYYCPECRKEFRTRACISPVVTLISKRTDGRTCLYTEFTEKK